MTTERLDALPLVRAQMQQLHLPDLLASYCAVHGPWPGLGPGWLTTTWRAHLLAHAAPRLSYRQPGVAGGLLSLQQRTAHPIRPLDCSAARLARLRERFSQEDPGHRLEAARHSNLRRVYDLPPTRERCDRTTASGYGPVDAAGRWQCGRANNGRAERPPLQVMLARLDPLPLPLATNVVAGQRAADPLSCPVSQRVRRGLGPRGLRAGGEAQAGPPGYPRVAAGGPGRLPRPAAAQAMTAGGVD